MQKNILSGCASAFLLFVGGTQAAVVYHYDVSDHNTSNLIGTWTGDTANLSQNNATLQTITDQHMRLADGDFSVFLDGQTLGLAAVTLTEYGVGDIVASLQWLVRGGTNFQQQTIGDGTSHGLGFFTRWNNQENAGFIIGGSRIQQTTFDASLVGAPDSWKSFTVNLLKETDSNVKLALHINNSPTANLTSSSTVAWSTIAAYDGLSTRTAGNFVGLAELNIEVVPEPSAALLGGLGCLVLFRRRRSGGVEIPPVRGH